MSSLELLSDQSDPEGKTRSRGTLSPSLRRRRSILRRRSAVSEGRVKDGAEGVNWGVVGEGRIVKERSSSKYSRDEDREW